MWILQGLMVCCVIMGMSKMARAEEFQKKYEDYKQDLKVDIKEWKTDYLELKRELKDWRKKEIKNLMSERNLKLKKIDDRFDGEVEKLVKAMQKKSHQFQLKSDLALVWSIKFKRQKFNEKKSVLRKYYKDLKVIETTFNKKYKEFKTESFREKRDLLNNNKPTFFPEFSKMRSEKSVKKYKKLKAIENKFCKLQKYYQKQQFQMDYSFSRYENIQPLEMSVKHLKNLTNLANQEVEVLEESLSAMNVMVEQIGKTPKERRKLRKQMKKARKSQKYFRKKYDEDINQLTFLKSGLKAAKSKREALISCDSDIMISNIETPTNLNEHSRIGEVY